MKNVILGLVLLSSVSVFADTYTCTLNTENGTVLNEQTGEFNNIDFHPSQKFPCGLQGSVDDRIRDCSYQLTSEKEGFVLVTRTKEFKEVHKETKTGLLWGDRLPSTMTHYNAEKACKAEVAGISNSGAWRLPSKEEYEEAEKNGIRKALPNMNYYFWSSSVHRSDSNFAWLFNGDNGVTFWGYRDYDDGVVSVRCVAR